MSRSHIHVCLPDFSGGGAERVMVSVLNSLQHSETVKCVVLQSKGPLKQAVSRECDILDLKTTSARSALFKLARTFKTERPDIVISTMAYFNFVVMLALLMSGHKPQTIALREANTPSSTLKSTSIGWLYRLLYRLFYNRADVVICNSNQVRAELIDLRVDPKKIQLIPNPVDVQSIRKMAASPLHLPTFKAPSLPLFVSIGRLTHQKGMDRLINWLNRMKTSANLLIVGDGPLENVLKEQSKAQGIADQVAFLGFQDNPFPFILKAQAFVLASRWEGMPNAALESLALGRKVIATSTSGALADLEHKVPPEFLVIAETEDAFISAMEDTAYNNDKEIPSLPASRLPQDCYHAKVIAQYKSALLSDGKSR